MPVVTQKTMGFVASVIGAYQRQIENNHKVAQDAQSEYVGTVGERKVFPQLTLTKTRSYPNSYGETFVYVFVDQEGNLLVWKASKEQDWLKQGETYDVTATVKDHKLYNNNGTQVRQTLITRVKQRKR